MPKGIIVFGLNGSGKSTTAREIAKLLNYKHMDIEDYHFIKSDIPYTKERTREECLKMMLEDIKEHENFVLSAVTGDFGDEIESLYELGVFLTAPHSTRIERVKQRGLGKFGDRVKKGGDMYQANEKFMNFITSRTHTGIEKWIESISCPIIHIDGTRDIIENTNLIKDQYFRVLED